MTIAASTPETRASRCGALLLLLACAILLAAALRDVAAPWEHGMRGTNAALYSDVAVAHTLRYGLGTTLGMPAFVVEQAGQTVRNVNWHHPPAYWLFLSLAAWLFGHENVVLRLAHLLLFLPGLFALFALVRQRAGPVPAGIVAVLFASAPLVAYFGPMVVQDGAVLGIGLVTVWRFQCHVRAPSWRSWSLTALAFFAVTSLDYPGYWWGLAMFVLALASEPRRRAIRTVFSLFPVAVLAFAVMAVHYGVEFGGPIGFVRKLVDALSAESCGQQALTWPRVEHALHELFVAQGNAPLVLMAAAGCALALVLRDERLRTLACVGGALLVPGLLNCVVMPSHALAHAFWSMHGFAGLAVLASVVPLVGLQWLTGDRVRPIAGAALLAAGAATAAWGVYQTHTIVGRYSYVENGTPALMQKALPHLQRCTWTLTSAPPVPQVQFGHTSLFGGIDSPEKLQLFLDFGRQNLRGIVGFVVPPQHGKSPVVQGLDTLAKPVAVDEVLVYQLVF